MKHILRLLLMLATLSGQSQNLFPVKLDNCKTDKFCLDCGDPKAGYDQQEFDGLLEKLNQDLDLQGISGTIKFQVLIDDKGRGCVLSHTDQSKNRITKKIIRELNDFRKWTPAVSEGKVEEKTSVNLSFVIRDNRVQGQIERVDMDAFKKSFDSPKAPEIFNEKYVYRNDNLKNYRMTVWNSQNSNLPNHWCDHITIDRNGLVWLTIDEGLVNFDGKEFHKAEQNITDQGKFFTYYAIATDNDNTKWVYATKNLYSVADGKWTKYDPAVVGIDGGYDIINNPATGEVFFCSDEGLTILKDGQWSNLNQKKVPEFPSDRVSFAKRDSRNRLWIGTFNGTVMIDEHGKATNFEKSETVLKGRCITAMDEDESGNLYFTLYKFGPNPGGKVNREEGIAIRNSDGTFRHFTTDNSGMPYNHATDVLYDRNEEVLWIATDRAGLVRFDLKDGWENYHNENSQIPTSYISAMRFDKNGHLHLATRQGLVKLERL